LRSESETITIGGLDQVDAAVFGDFDYVALGHLHRSQAIGGEQIRYAGSPLKYSFSEARQEKSLTMVELGCKGELHICQLPLQPLHDMREIKGSLATLISSAVVMSADREDYLRVILTDREDLTDPLEQLRMVYPHIMRLDFADKTWLPRIATDQNRVLQDPLTLFGEFYQLQQGSILSDEKREIVRHLLVELEGARV
ncbi:MAG: exonuclease SbcCD subunit D C-terminal domain-containing protein, partial [Clostridiales bacterium]